MSVDWKKENQNARSKTVVKTNMLFVKIFKCTVLTNATVSAISDTTQIPAT
jgi:hypothetical protein